MRYTIVLFLILSCIMTEGYSQGRLGKAEQSLQKEKNKEGSQSSSGDSETIEIVGSIVGGIIDAFISSKSNSTSNANTSTLSDEEFYASFDSIYHPKKSKPKRKRITKYPYYDSEKGHYNRNQSDSINSTSFRTTLSNRWIVADPKLYGGHFNAQFRFATCSEIEFNHLQLWEHGTFIENNTLGITTGLYKVNWGGETFEFTLGIGTTYVAGEVDKWMMTVPVEIEYFFTKPLSIEMNMHASRVLGGTDNEKICVFNTLFNYHLKRWKISGGYEYLKIGTEDFSMASIGVGVTF